MAEASFVHIIFSWKIITGLGFPSFVLSCSEVVCDVSETPPPHHHLRKQTVSQSQPSSPNVNFIHTLVFYFFLRFKASGKDSLEQPSEIRTVPWRISVRRGCYLFALPAILPLSPKGTKPGRFCLMLIKSLC